MATDLKRIREKASKNRNEVFTSLWHHVCDVDHLRVCYETLDGKKAVGIDGVDKKVYGENLEPSWGSTTTVERPRRATSRSNANQPA